MKKLLATSSHTIDKDKLMPKKSHGLNGSMSEQIEATIPKKEKNSTARGGGSCCLAEGPRVW